MTNNLFETQYDLTKKSKLREFYETKKIWIYSIIFLIIFFVLSYSYYKNREESKKILLSENYIQAKVHLENGNKVKALQILKNITFSNDSTYSTLSFAKMRSPGNTGPISIWPGTSATVMTEITPSAFLTAERSIERIVA